MSTELAIQPDQTGFSEKQVAALRSLGVEDAPPGDVALLFHQSVRTGLDPFLRQIYLIGRASREQINGQWRDGAKKWTIQTGIDGFRVIRDRKGNYQGQVEQWCGEDGIWRDAWLSEAPPVAARIFVYLEGKSHPIPAVALFREYAQTDRNGNPQAMWKKMPAGQLMKCAEALALRKAYPQDLSGVYIDEEMQQADVGADGVPSVTSVRSPAAVTRAPRPEPAFDPAPWEDALVEASNLGALRKLWLRAEAERVLDRQLSNGKTLRAVMLATKAHMEQDARDTPQPAQEAQKAPETPQEAAQPVLVPAIDYDDPTPF